MPENAVIQGFWVSGEAAGRMTKALKRVSRHFTSPVLCVRAWPVWSMPRWLIVFILIVVSVDLAAIGAATAVTRFTVHDAGLFVLLVACTATAVEMTSKSGEQSGMIKDVHGVWELPVAILLPPFYALVIPVIRVALTQLRVRRAQVHRRIFTAASVSLSYGAASVAFHGLSELIPRASARTVSHGLAWIALVALSNLIKTVLNRTMIVVAVKGSDPDTSIRALVFRREPLYNDAAESCTSILVTYCVAGSPLLALAALPVVTLLQRSLRHVQLLKDARSDSKTGLLNAATWEREATAEITRAVRTRTSLAVALLDVDKFKAVNDTHGHMVGDQVLKEIARMLGSQLREYDLAGRFGGEEFAVVLPQTRAVDAFRIAERVRASIAGMSVIAPGAAGAEWVRVTVSIGVAALDSGTKRDYAELMATADAALYRAKAGGRDQVQMISTTRGLSAISGAGASGPGAASTSGRGPGENYQEKPSVFSRARTS
jgi:diguanylate cyclase (GGDEF)-like protein